MILPAALLIQIIIYSYSFLLSCRLLSPDRKDVDQVWLDQKHKLQHAEKEEAGPVPFLPFSSSSSMLLQLSVEP